MECSAYFPSGNFELFHSYCFLASVLREQPHQHKTWGITGVFHNKLNVNTYEMLEALKRLKKQRVITASMGEVGYLFPGCIHNVSNPSHELSASFHVFNNLPGIENPEENAIWYPSPRRHNLSKGLIDRALATCLAVVNSIETEQSFNIIKRIYRRSSVSIKLLSIQSMYKFDQSYTKKCFNELQASF